MWSVHSSELENIFMFAYHHPISSEFYTSDVATGVKGGRVPPRQQKNCQKSGKRGRKSRKIGKMRKKSGRFFHVAPPDR